VTRSIAALVDEAAGRLERAGFPPADARTDVGVIARHLLGWNTAQWLGHVQDIAPSGFATELNAAIARRARHEPVAYITGEKEFYGRPFRVTRDVLVPRPETELVVEAALSSIKLAPRPRPQAPGLRVFDVGTGSGILAVTLAAELSGAIIVATDISPAAIEVARSNAVRHQVDDRIAFVEGSLFGGQLQGCDLVVSNPPYVPRRDRESLSSDVRDFEPEHALFAGDDGLDVIRELVPTAAKALAPGGSLVMEIGFDQSDDVRTIAEHAGFTDVRFVADLQGTPRVLTARA
jgi:release factor glutamine methyltransferase